MSDVLIGGLENLDQLQANGDISARDQVELTGDEQVEAVSSDGVSGYGVAMYDASSGDRVAIATVGAKVEVNSTSVSVDDFVTSNGASGSAGQVATADITGDEILGIATTATSGGVCEIMIALGGEVN